MVESVSSIVIVGARKQYSYSWGAQFAEKKLH